MFSATSTSSKIALAALVVSATAGFIGAQDIDPFCYNPDTWKYPDGSEAPPCQYPYAREFLGIPGSYGFDGFPCMTGDYRQVCCDEDQAGAADSPYEVTCGGVSGSAMFGTYGIQKLPSKRRL